MSDRERLESYVRESLKKAGKPQSEIDSLCEFILSMKILQSKEAVDAFIKAGK
jgi:hypothetical protein